MARSSVQSLTPHKGVSLVRQASGLSAVRDPLLPTERLRGAIRTEITVRVGSVAAGNQGHGVLRCVNAMLSMRWLFRCRLAGLVRTGPSWIRTGVRAGSELVLN